MKNSKANHCMIDLETIGTQFDSAIVSIGAVIFDPRFAIKKSKTYYIELDWQQQLEDAEYPRSKNEDTIRWWKGQSEHAKKALKGKEELDWALGELSAFITPDMRVWGNGSTFDITMLEHAYIVRGLKPPWKFWNVRDCRTVLDMYESSRGGLAKGLKKKASHNALEDAQSQAEQICEMWHELVKV